MVCLSTRVQHGQTAPKFFGDSQFITFFLEQILLCKEGNNRFHFRMDTRRNSHRDMDMVPNIQNQGEYSQKYKLCLLHIQSHKLVHSHKLSREPRDPRDSRPFPGYLEKFGKAVWAKYMRILPMYESWQKLSHRSAAPSLLAGQSSFFAAKTAESKRLKSFILCLK